jgi:hypothetical protein
MATMSGADADQLDEVGRRMTQAADHLDNIRHEVTTALGRAPWEGDDAADFQGLWNHRLAGLLQTTTAATRDASSRLHRNADQQRRASGSDTGNPLAPTTRFTAAESSGVDLGGLWDKASLAAGGIMLGKDYLEHFKDVKAVDKFLRRPLVDALLKERSIPGIAEDATGVKGIIGDLDDIGPLALVSTAVDSYRLGSLLAQGKFNRDTLDAGVDTVLDVASVAFPPAAIVIDTGHLLFDGYEMLPDNVHKAIEGAVASGATAVASAAVDGAKADLKVAEDVASTAGHIVSGGVDGVKKIFGF